LLYHILLAFATLIKVSILYVHESIHSPFQKALAENYMELII